MLRYNQIENYPFVLRMSTPHGTKTWHENSAYARLSETQRAVAYTALGRSAYPFTDPENQGIGEVVTVSNLLKSVPKRWFRKTAQVPVYIKEIVDEIGYGEYAAVSLDYEAVRLHGSGGSVALRGILPADVAEIASQEMHDPSIRRGLLKSFLETSTLAPILLPNFSALDQHGLSFKLVSKV